MIQVPNIVANNISIMKDDLPDTAIENAINGGIVAFDLETSGLDWKRDRIATCQLYIPNDKVYIIQVQERIPTNICKIVKTENVIKVFHHAMFDLRFMRNQWSLRANNIVCTKVASKILYPQKRNHSLKALLCEHLSIRIIKDQATSNWSSEILDNAQVRYAVNDVLYLLDLSSKLIDHLKTDNLYDVSMACFAFIPYRVELDITGHGDVFLY
jgi:ribonuclease D